MFNIPLSLLNPHSMRAIGLLTVCIVLIICATSASGALSTICGVGAVAALGGAAWCFVKSPLYTNRGVLQEHAFNSS